MSISLANHYPPLTRLRTYAPFECCLLQIPPMPPPPDHQNQRHHHDRRTILTPQRRTNPFTWLLAIACALLSTTVIAVGVFLVIIYAVYHPRIPFLSVSYSQLLRLDYNPNSQPFLGTKMAVNLLAVNRNPRSHVGFSQLGLSLRFGSSRTNIAELRSSPFGVPKNGTFPIGYIVESLQVPLNQAAKDDLDVALRMNRIAFKLQGRARTRWRIGVLLRVGFWTHISCQLLFFPSNGSSIAVDCDSKSHH
ncbi:Late embryogenesis abundant (LEA)hydroxyproline-rich glycoprotein family [Zostera marina]|uniref:Late embryogenesis abundant (LEA)hydroxyproline-rich glycoprotein family n=1 Tax=Zostera marina TaxID=29655 RepID=A0A0K9NQY5_ZOSMR|nr:Late embryogenesis abundant (LEA)hydroxyproline-rich glycoprotein family [Zostera marina]